MRPATIIGIVLLAVGGYLFFQGGSFTTSEDVLKVGDLKVSAKESHPIAPWMAGAAMIGGILLIVVGVRQKA